MAPPLWLAIACAALECPTSAARIDRRLPRIPITRTPSCPFNSFEPTKEGEMNPVSAARSGMFSIGGQIQVTRLGFGAMRITGPGVWGEPADPDEARRTLARLPELGVKFIDTADSYGPSVSERLIREVLHPYDGLVIATKGGLTRPGPDQWLPLGDPDYLIAQAKKSRETLGLARISLWQLHRIDPKVARDAQFTAISELLRSGVIEHAGLSEVSIADIEAARKHFKVATVQNRYNLAYRQSEDVLNYCDANGIGFIPWFPLAVGDLARRGGVLDRIARNYGATVNQIALAWLLKRSPVILPIPGTSKLAHLEENVAAAGIALLDEDFAQLDVASRR
jgi:aryl-alcohol dehydrogenase-like predicted oxidoreductase